MGWFSFRALALGLGLWACAAPALAQSTDDEARAAFQEGVVLAEHGDWTAAVESFQRALTLRDAPTIRYNLAQSLVHLGRLTEALAELDAMSATAPVPVELEEGVRALRDELTPRIGRLTVRVRGEMSGCNVEVGLRSLEASALGAPMAVDPGPQRVRLICGHTIADEVEVSVPEGGASHVVLAVVEADRHPVVDEVPEEVVEPVAPPGGTSVTDEPWFWVVLGIVAAGAVAGVTAGVVVATSQPNQGDFMPGRLEFGP